jgi:hypothetical protein
LRGLVVGDRVGVLVGVTDAAPGGRGGEAVGLVVGVLVGVTDAAPGGRGGETVGLAVLEGEREVVEEGKAVREGVTDDVADREGVGGRLGVSVGVVVGLVVREGDGVVVAVTLEVDVAD